MNRIVSSLGCRLLATMALAAVGTGAWAGALTLQPNLPQLQIGAGGAILPTLAPGAFTPHVRDPLAPAAGGRPGYLALSTAAPLDQAGPHGSGPIGSPLDLPINLQPMGTAPPRGPIRLPDLVPALLTADTTEVRLLGVTRPIVAGSGVDPLAATASELRSLHPGLSVATSLFTPGGSLGALSYCDEAWRPCTAPASTPADPANVLTVLYVGSYDWVRAGGGDFEFLYSLVNLGAFVYLDLSDLARGGIGDIAPSLAIDAGFDATQPYFSVHRVNAFVSDPRQDRFDGALDVTDDILARYRNLQTPEPGTLALLAAALGVAGRARRRRVRRPGQG